MSGQGRTKEAVIKPTEVVFQVLEVPIDQLHPDPANPRRISGAELEALTQSIRRWGLPQPILVRREDNMVVAGHQRLLAARKLGYKAVPVIFLDLTLEESRAFNIALNKTGGEFDDDLLARVMSDLRV